MTQSLAFWVENSSENMFNTLGLELHFNYWHLPDDKINYLDIGVLISGKNKFFDSINVYLPFKYNIKSYIPTLGDKVVESEKLISAVFNNDVSNIKPIRECSAKYIVFSEQKDSEGIVFFTNLSHGTSEGRVLIEEHSEDDEVGTIIKFSNKIFNCSEEYKEKNWYLRFRYILEKEDIDNISREYKSKDSLITYYFEKSEVVDFRVNESRNLPKTIREKVATCREINKVHFFLIRNESSEFKIGHTTYDRCRILEDKLWDSYLCYNKDTQVKTKMLIYHWKTKSEKNIEYFSAFARFMTRKVGLKEVMFVILCILVLGTISSLLATALTNIIT